VGLHSSGVTNVLSLSKLIEEDFRVRIEEATDPTFVVESFDGSTFRFVEHRGVYVLDVKHSKQVELKGSIEEPQSKKYKTSKRSSLLGLKGSLVTCNEEPQRKKYKRI